MNATLRAESAAGSSPRLLQKRAQTILYGRLEFARLNHRFTRDLSRPITSVGPGDNPPSFIETISAPVSSQFSANFHFAWLELRNVSTSPGATNSSVDSVGPMTVLRRGPTVSNRPASSWRRASRSYPSVRLRVRQNRSRLPS
jgi:hypothetical protein